MWDKAGNIYYDTEDARTGVYMVSGAKLLSHAAAAATTATSRANYAAALAAVS